MYKSKTTLNLSIILFCLILNHSPAYTDGSPIKTKISGTAAHLADQLKHLLKASEDHDKEMKDFRAQCQTSLDSALALQAKSLASSPKAIWKIYNGLEKHLENFSANFNRSYQTKFDRVLGLPLIEQILWNYHQVIPAISALHKIMKELPEPKTKKGILKRYVFNGRYEDRPVNYMWGSTRIRLYQYCLKFLKKNKIEALEEITIIYKNKETKIFETTFEARWNPEQICTLTAVNAEINNQKNAKYKVSGQSPYGIHYNLVEHRKNILRNNIRFFIPKIFNSDLKRIFLNGRLYTDTERSSIGMIPHGKIPLLITNNIIDLKKPFYVRGSVEEYPFYISGSTKEIIERKFRSFLKTFELSLVDDITIFGNDEHGIDDWFDTEDIVSRIRSAIKRR